MTRNRRPIAFIATQYPDAARAFYGDIMGLTLLDASPFALVFRDGDVMLRVQIVPKVQPAPYTVHGWQTRDIAGCIADLSAKGVTFTRFDGLTQDETGVWTTPDGSQIAWFTDPDDNILSLTQFPAA